MGAVGIAMSVSYFRLSRRRMKSAPEAPTPERAACSEKPPAAPAALREVSQHYLRRRGPLRKTAAPSLEAGLGPAIRVVRAALGCTEADGRARRPSVYP